LFGGPLLLVPCSALGAVPMITGMVGGELMKLDPAFKHVRGVAVTESMAAELVVFFVETALRFGDVNGGPDAGLAHGFLVVVEGLAKASA
jgi:hypothetical protein